MTRYLILEEGSYSDYSVSFLELPAAPITEDEIIELLNVGKFNGYRVGGHIHGELETDLDIIDLQQHAQEWINLLFLCSEGKPCPTVVDRLYTRDECLECVLKNDSSGDTTYWRRHIYYRYQQYTRAYALYQKAFG